MYYFFKVHLHHFSKIKTVGIMFFLPYYFCLMMERSKPWAGSVSLTNGSGSGRPKKYGSSGSGSATLHYRPPLIYPWLFKAVPVVFLSFCNNICVAGGAGKVEQDEDWRVDGRGGGEHGGGGGGAQPGGQRRREAAGTARGGRDPGQDHSSVADSLCLSRIPDPKTAKKERGEKKFLGHTFYVATNFTKLKITLVLKCWRKQFGPIFKVL